MSKNIENIDRYLKGVELPEHVSYQHQQRLRREVLGKIERRQTMSVRVKSWKVAAVIAVVIGAGALATTVGQKVLKLYFRGREPDGTYIFSTEPETVDIGNGRTVTGSRMVGVRVDPNQAIDVEQKKSELEKELAEIDLLRQQNARELVSVIEREVNGELWSRGFMFKYVLSDGRQVVRGDNDPDLEKKNLTEAQQDELINLMRADEEVDISFMEKQVRGRMFSFECHKFVLSDGTEIIWSRGTPKDDQ